MNTTSAPSSHRPRRRRTTTALAAAVLAVSLGGTAVPAHAAPGLSVSSDQEAEATVSGLPAGTYQTFTGSNGTVLDYHFFDNAGDNGTIYYFDGDGTTNFDWPTTDPSNVWYDGIPGNGHVQRINSEAAARGMDLVFLDHPENSTGGRSWWNGVDADAAAVAVRELVQVSDAEQVLLAGYSGGSEFFARHLLLNGTDWLPTNSTAVFIGGGGLAGLTPAQPTKRMADMPLVWEVGENDVEGAALPVTWSALRVSRDAEAGYRQQGYQQTGLNVIPDTNHVQYNYKGIVGKHADELLQRVKVGKPKITRTSPVAPGRSSVSFEVKGLTPGSVPTLSLTLPGGQTLTAQPEDGNSVDSDGRFTGTVHFSDFRVRPRTGYLLTATDDHGRVAETTLRVGESRR